MAGGRDRREHLAAGGIDLVDARLGDLVEIPAVEGAAGVAGALERARGLAALGIERDQLRTEGRPDPAAVVGDAVDLIGEGAVLAHDLSRTHRCFVYVFACLSSHCLSPLRPAYAGGSAAGSNKIVVNPASGGASQRRRRARPIERTRPAASSSTSARWTMR